MVLYFTQTLQQALDAIHPLVYHKFPVHDEQRERTEDINETKIIEAYGCAKWNIVDILNETFSLNSSLYNWLEFNESDEIAYFLNEAGSNTLHNSQFKAPYAFHLWLGKRGFIIGIEQQGKGFNAEEVHRKKIKEREGAAFDFYRRAKSSIFFDNPTHAKVVFMQALQPDSGTASD